MTLQDHIKNCCFDFYQIESVFWISLSTEVMIQLRLMDDQEKQIMHESRSFSCLTAYFQMTWNLTCDVHRPPFCLTYSFCFFIFSISFFEGVYCIWPYNHAHFSFHLHWVLQTNCWNSVQYCLKWFVRQLAILYTLYVCRSEQ